MNVSHSLALSAKNCCFCDGCLGFYDKLYKLTARALYKLSLIRNVVYYCAVNAVLPLEWRGPAKW